MVQGDHLVGVHSGHVLEGAVELLDCHIELVLGGEAAAEVDDGDQAVLRVALGDLELFQRVVDRAAFPEEFGVFEADLEVVRVQADALVVAFHAVIVVRLDLGVDLFLGLAFGLHLFDLALGDGGVGLFDRLVDGGVERAHLFDDPVVRLDGLFVFLGPEIEFGETAAGVDGLVAFGDLLGVFFDHLADIVLGADDAVALVRIALVEVLLEVGLSALAPLALFHGGEGGGFTQEGEFFEVAGILVGELLADGEVFDALSVGLVVFAELDDVGFVLVVLFDEELVGFHSDEHRVELLCGFGEERERGGVEKVERERFLGFVHGLFRLLGLQHVALGDVSQRLDGGQRLGDGAHLFEVVALALAEFFAGVEESGVELHDFLEKRDRVLQVVLVHDLHRLGVGGLGSGGNVFQGLFDDSHK